MSNLPTARPMPPSTATKTGRCAIGKRKGTTSTDQKREGTNKKKKASGPAKKTKKPDEAKA